MTRPKSIKVMPRYIYLGIITLFFAARSKLKKPAKRGRQAFDTHKRIRLTSSGHHLRLRSVRVRWRIRRINKYGQIFLSALSDRPDSL